MVASSLESVPKGMLRLPDGLLIPVDQFDSERMILGGIWAYLSGQKITLDGYQWLMENGALPHHPHKLGEDFVVLARGEYWAMVGITPDLERALAEWGAV